MRARSTGRYEILDHAADAAVVASGSTPEEAFANAAEGMYALMADPSGVGEGVRREVRVTGEGREHLLERWLLELLFLTETEGLLFRRFEVEAEGDTALRGVALGEPLDPARHALGPAVKAVTRHGMEVAPGAGGWRARVLLDL